MSCSAKMRKLSVRIDADLKAAFEGTLRDIGVDPTCAMRSFAFQIVLEGSIPFDPVDAGFEASGKTAVTSAKIPEDVAGEMESVLKGLGTNFSQVVRLLALQTVFGNGFLDTLAARFRQSGKRTADVSDFCLPEHQGLVHPLARAVELDESSMVDHPVDHRGGKLVVSQDRSPFAELDVGGEHHASLLVAC